MEKIMLLKSNSILFALFLLALGLPCLPAQAQSTTAILPASVNTATGTSFDEIGHSDYRKFGFLIYDISLWATQKAWEPTKPYALQLVYARSLSKETLVDAVMDDISDQDVADDVTLARWRTVLNASLRAVNAGDTLIGLALPGKKTLLFYNGNEIASIKDQGLSHAFFGIWLGQKADEDLRSELLGNT